MIETWLTALEASSLSREIRQSVWLYPVANVAHIVGLMVFFASVAAMDTKAVVGSKTFGELRYFNSRVRPVALTALAVQAGTGILMFLPEATHVAHNRAFQIKVALILLALSNALLFSWVLRSNNSGTSTTSRLFTMAIYSLVLWSMVAVFGRLIAYF